jgi:glycosyltransferase involved in cell wall biosynthesis
MSADSIRSVNNDNSVVGQRFIHLGLGWIGDRGGGLERYQDGICRAHALMGYGVEAWVQSRNPIETHIGYPVTAYASPMQPRGEKLRKLRALAKIRFKTPDFTFVSHHASVSSPLVSKLRGIPHLVHFQGPWADEAAVEGAPPWKTWLQRLAECKAYRSADRIITLSQAFADLVIERYGVEPGRVRVVPGGIDALKADPGLSRREAREKLGWPTDRPILLSIRRLVRRVGINKLIEAAKELTRQHPDLLVLVGGTGPLRDEFETRIKELALENHVKLLGFVPDGDLPIAYAAADYSIVPTQELEGFGLVTIESMAAGTPSVVTPVGSLPEIAGPLDSNLVLPGRTKNDIVAGVKEILSGGVTLPDATTCRRYVRDHYDWRVIAPRVLDVYQQAAR